MPTPAFPHDHSPGEGLRKIAVDDEQVNYNDRWFGLESPLSQVFRQRRCQLIVPKQVCRSVSRSSDRILRIARRSLSPNSSNANSAASCRLEPSLVHHTKWKVSVNGITAAYLGQIRGMRHLNSIRRVDCTKLLPRAHDDPMIRTLPPQR